MSAKKRKLEQVTTSSLSSGNRKFDDVWKAQQNQRSDRQKSHLIVFVLACHSLPFLCVEITVHGRNDVKFFLKCGQDAVGDGILRPRCRHLAIATRQRCLTSDRCHYLATGRNIRVVLDSGLFHPSYENMASSIKPEVHNMSHFHQMRTESRPQITRTGNLEKFGHLFLGRLFDRVDLIKPVSNVCPSVCAYVRSSTKSFFNFNEIWRVGRGR